MKKKPTKIKLPKGFTINPELNHKYDNNPYFLKKAEEARQLLKKFPIPEEFLPLSKNKITASQLLF